MHPCPVRHTTSYVRVVGIMILTLFVVLPSFLYSDIYTGHLRYSSNNTNNSNTSTSRALAMNLDELTQTQPDYSFAAQYLLTRVKSSGRQQLALKL